MRSKKFGSRIGCKEQAFSGTERGFCVWVDLDWILLMKFRWFIFLDIIEWVCLESVL